MIVEKLEKVRDQQSSNAPAVCWMHDPVFHVFERIFVRLHRADGAGKRRPPFVRPAGVTVTENDSPRSRFCERKQSRGSNVDALITVSPDSGRTHFQDASKVSSSLSSHQEEIVQLAEEIEVLASANASRRDQRHGSGRLPSFSARESDPGPAPIIPDRPNQMTPPPRVSRLRNLRSPSRRGGTLCVRYKELKLSRCIRVLEKKRVSPRSLRMHPASIRHPTIPDTLLRLS
jgi:hypothetical protein